MTPPASRPPDTSRLSHSTTLPTLLIEQAARAGERRALRHKRLGVWHQSTWRRLAQRVEALASGLALRGFGPGDTLLLLSHPNEEALLLSLAVLWRGGVVASVDPAVTDDALTTLIERLSPRLSFADDDPRLDRLLALSPQSPGGTLVIDANLRRLRAHPDGRVIDFGTLTSDVPCVSLAQPDKDAFVVISGIAETRFTHATVIRDAQHVAAAAQLDAHDDALAARSLASPEHARFLVALWLVAGFRLNLPESLETRDADRREIAPQLIVGTRESYGRLTRQVAVRLPVDSSSLRRLLGAAANRSAWRMLPLIGWWSVARPLRSVLGFKRVRSAFVIDAALDAEAAALFKLLRIDVQTWPDGDSWQASRQESVVAQPSRGRIGQPA